MAISRRLQYHTILCCSCITDTHSVRWRLHRERYASFGVSSECLNQFTSEGTYPDRHCYLCMLCCGYYLLPANLCIKDCCFTLPSWRWISWTLSWYVTQKASYGVGLGWATRLQAVRLKAVLGLWKRIKGLSSTSLSTTIILCIRTVFVWLNDLLFYYQYSTEILERLTGGCPLFLMEAPRRVLSIWHAAALPLVPIPILVL